MKKMIFFICLLEIIINLKVVGQDNTAPKSYSSLIIIFADNSSNLSGLSDGQKKYITNIGDSIFKLTDIKFLYYYPNYESPVILKKIKYSRDVFNSSLYGGGYGSSVHYLSDRDTILSSLNDEKFVAGAINIYILFGSGEWQLLLKSPIEVASLIKDMPLQIKTLYSASNNTVVKIHIVYSLSFEDQIDQIKYIAKFHSNNQIIYNYEPVQ